MTTWEFAGGCWRPGGGIAVDDRAVRYGMSVFETVGVCEGRPLFLAEHVERLGRALADLAGIRPGALPSALPPLTTGVFRIIVTAGPGAPSDPWAGGIYGIGEECPVGTRFPALRLVTDPAPITPAPGGWKTGNYWPHIRALAHARARGADDAVVVNPSGEVTGCSMASLFLLVDGEWITPASASGARDGVVRAWVRSLMPVRETTVVSDDLARAVSAFTTNSRTGIRAVAEIDARPLRPPDPAIAETCARDVLAPQHGPA